MDTTRNARLGANIKYFHARGMNMSKNKTLSAAKSAKNDEFYTQYADVRNCQMLCKTHNRAKGNR